MKRSTPLPRTSWLGPWVFTNAAWDATVLAFVPDALNHLWPFSRVDLDNEAGRTQEDRDYRDSLIARAGVVVEYRRYYSIHARAEKTFGLVRMSGEEWPTIPEATA